MLRAIPNTTASNKSKSGSSANLSRPLPIPPSTIFAISAAPVSVSASVPGYREWKPRLDLDEMDDSPFSESFSGLNEENVELEKAQDTSTLLGQKSFIIKRYTDPKEMDPGWQDDEIDEIVVISPKPPTIRKRSSNSSNQVKLPIIPEYSQGVNHGKCQSPDESVKLADFEFLPTPTSSCSPGYPSTSHHNTTIHSNSKSTTHICAFRKSGGALQLNGLYTVKRRTHIASLNANLAWRELDVMHVITEMRVPFVEKMYGTFVDAENIYLVLGHYTRGSLADMIASHGPLNDVTSRAYASELLCALESLHGAGIIHNDVRPANIHIEANRHITLTNFEVADLREETPIRAETYGRNAKDCLAPEVLLGWAHDSAVDVWGFGMVLGWMVAGRHPFLGTVDSDTLREAELESKILYSRLDVDDVNGSARDLIMKCLERNPAVRLNCESIKHHDYFGQTDWKKVVAKHVAIPGFKHRRKESSVSMHTTTSGHVGKEIYPTHPTCYSAPLQQARITQDTLSGIPPRGDSAEITTDIVQESREAAVADDSKETADVSSLRVVKVQVQEQVETGLSRCRDDVDHPRPEMHTKELTPQERMALFWEEIDTEEVMERMHSQVKGLSETSPRPRKLRKKSSSMRTLTHRISTFSLTAQAPNKLRKKEGRRISTMPLVPRNMNDADDKKEFVVKPAKEVLAFPQGVKQIGDGIGFTYNIRAAAKSKASICTDKSIPGWKKHIRLFPSGLGRGIREVRHRLSMGKLTASASQGAERQKDRRDAMEFERDRMSQDDGYYHESSEFSFIAHCQSSPASEAEPLTPDTLAFNGQDVHDGEYVKDVEHNEKSEGSLEDETIDSMVYRTSTLRLVPTSPPHDDRCSDDLSLVNDASGVLACFLGGRDKDPCAGALSDSFPALLLLLLLSLAPALSLLLLDLAPPCRLPEMDEPMAVDAPTPFLAQQGPSTAADKEWLPFPGELGPDGKLTTQYLNIAGQKKIVLQEWCTGFRLPKTGNMKTLADRLREFSLDRKRWDSLRAGTTNSHRNLRPTTVRAKPKGTTLRRELLLRGTPELSTSSTPVRTALPTQRSVDNRTPEQKAAILSWAKRFKDSHPYYPPGSPERQPKPRNQLASGSGLSNDQFSYIRDQLNLVTTHLSITPTPPTVAHPSSQSTPSAPDLPLASPPPASPSSPSPLLAMERRFSIQIANGTTIDFTARDVPDPPARSFATDLAGLAAVWDDASSSWDGRLALFSIHGSPIALVYWPQVYHSKPQQWKGTKGKWNEWKMIMEYWHRTTPAMFWAEFTVNGEHLTYTAILKMLRGKRMKADAETVEAARAKYGSEFDRIFTYEKHGRKLVMTDPSAIARHYRALQLSS